jgi:hypothetical protein
MSHPLRLAVTAILDNATAYEWSVQGFGMLRLYIRDIGRLHIWDSSLRYPDVSMVHNHSWDLRSTVVSGRLVNTRFWQHKAGAPHQGKRLITGYQTRDVQDLGVVLLRAQTPEIYIPGDVYHQRASEIHRTDAEDGTITLMERKEDEQGQADVYWHAGTEWGTAKPRPATRDEIVEVSQRALKVLGR